MFPLEERLAILSGFAGHPVPAAQRQSAALEQWKEHYALP